jgi:hypothetical protein
MLLAILRATRFFWTATRGHRLRPWRSEYLRWRMETYTGKPAGTLRFADFWHLLMTERGQLLRFLVWASEIQTLAGHEPQ